MALVVAFTPSDTEPPYTLPAIEDPNTGTFIMDSLAIATYLDDKYPETPKVCGPEAQAALEDIGDVFSPGSRGGTEGATSTIPPRLVFLVLAADRLNPVSEEFYHRTRAARHGEPWTTVRHACVASPEERADLVRRGVEAITGVWRKQTAVYERAEGPFVLGKKPCLLDFGVVGRIKFVLDGLVPEEVEAVTSLEGGRLVEDLEKYYEC